MKILYLSAHSILEYDEVKLFHELGHEVFSPGAYLNPNQPQDMRPAISSLIYDEETLNHWHQICGNNPGQDSKEYLTKDFVDRFDMVIVMHLPRWIVSNWEAMKHKRVIWRTIGQSINKTEAQILPYRKQGLQIVRYSPKERNIPGYIGEDVLIRFYKDPDEYKDWNGDQRQIITFAQSMKNRGEACNFSFFEEVTRGYSRKLFGPGNENSGIPIGGKVSYEQMNQELRNNRVYFYTGTHPASYTLNFMESWMTGIPIVAIGYKYGNASYFPNHNLYEVSELLEHGRTGFVSDSIIELRACISRLLKDHDFAKQISENARVAAIKYFGKDIISEQWEQFLDG